MRKIIASAYMTLDGRVDHLQEWTTPYDSDAVADYHSGLLASSGGLLLGRRTYDVFAAIWPPRAGRPAYAGRINRLPKYVATTTLTDLGWENSHRLEGDVAPAVSRLKEEAGGDLVLYGGRTMTRTLQEHDLIDEYRVLLHPVLLGRGGTFFDEGAPRVDLALVDSRVLGPGVVVLTYRPVR
jgi:dihydrofolate reductase